MSAHFFHFQSFIVRVPKMFSNLYPPADKRLLFLFEWLVLTIMLFAVSSILYEGRDAKEVVREDCGVLRLTPYGKSANVNNTTSNNTYVTYRRAHKNAPNNALVVQDICVVIASKVRPASNQYC